MNTKALLVGLGIAAVGVGSVVALFIKNSIEERNIKELSKEELVRILKLIRKEKYILYKQTATFAVNIARQTRGNVSVQMIEQFINGPESPFKVKEETEKITLAVCNANDCTLEIYNKSLDLFKEDTQVADLLKQQARDYQISLTGKMPPFNVVIPESLTKERYLSIQNQITKKSYLQQVAVFKKLAEYTEEELAQNPNILSELGNHEKEQEEILIEEGLGSEFDPPFAVFEMAGLKMRNDPTLRGQIAKIEEAYQRILLRYSMKIQNKTITAQELSDMEEEVIFLDPLMG